MLTLEAGFLGPRRRGGSTRGLAPGKPLERDESRGRCAFSGTTTRFAVRITRGARQPAGPRVDRARLLPCSFSHAQGCLDRAFVFGFFQTKKVGRVEISSFYLRVFETENIVAKIICGHSHKCSTLVANFRVLLIVARSFGGFGNQGKGAGKARDQSRSKHSLCTVTTLYLRMPMHTKFQ